jgi:indole-3-glycerol phosphate synthase
MAVKPPTILRKILARKAEEVAERRAIHSLASLEDRIQEQDAPRGFSRALAGGRRTVSGYCRDQEGFPSKGVIRENFQPALMALSYRDGGAAVSPCDRPDFFLGCDAICSRRGQP